VNGIRRPAYYLWRGEFNDANSSYYVQTVCMADSLNTNCMGCGVLQLEATGVLLYDSAFFYD